MRALPLLLLAGCATADAVILESWDGAADRRVARVIDDPDGLREVEAWLAKAYRPPLPPERMGAVLPAAAILRGSEVLWVYRFVSRTGREELVSEEAVERLFEIFARRGRPYEGPARSGGFRSVDDPDSPFRQP